MLQLAQGKLAAYCATPSFCFCSSSLFRDGKQRANRPRKLFCMGRTRGSKMWYFLTKNLRRGLLFIYIVFYKFLWCSQSPYIGDLINSKVFSRFNFFLLQIRQQKDFIGHNCRLFLSSYIVVYSGYGPLKVGIRR